jgi:integrase
MPRERHGGVRKRCGCPRRVWPKCPHAWHLNFKWKGAHHRLSLDREVGHPITNKTDALAEAERLRTAIRAGEFPVPAPVVAPAGITDQAAPLTFDQFAKVWSERRGSQLVRPRDNTYRLSTIGAFVLPGTVPPLTFGAKPLAALTTDDVEAFRDARKAAGLSAVTVNHDLKLLRKMFNWGIRKGYLERTPFKIGTEPAISLDKETPRAWRFAGEDDEQRLLKACDPHLHAVVVALLDTACRVGEILTLQWRNVNLVRRELVIEAAKAKTRTARIVPISTRLLGVLELRRHDAAGEEFGPDAYVFGNAVGELVTSIREPWHAAREAAGFPGLQLRDLRHEAGSRFDEAGVPINYVSKILGHTNLTTTSRYLNIHRRGLQSAMQTLERHREEQKQERERQEQERVAQALHAGADSAPASVPQLEEAPAGKQLPS